MELRLHASGNLDNTALAILCRHSVPTTRRPRSPTISASSLLREDHIHEAVVETPAFGLNVLDVLLAARLGTFAVLLFDLFLSLEALSMALRNCPALFWRSRAFEFEFDLLGVRDTHIRGLKNLAGVFALAYPLNLVGILDDFFGEVCRVVDLFCDLALQRWCTREDATSVDTGECPGFGYRIENLSAGGGMDGEVVDGFVEGLTLAVLGEPSGRNHFVYCASIR